MISEFFNYVVILSSSLISIFIAERIYYLGSRSISSTLVYKVMSSGLILVLLVYIRVGALLCYMDRIIRALRNAELN